MKKVAGDGLVKMVGHGWVSLSQVSVVAGEVREKKKEKKKKKIKIRGVHGWFVLILVSVFFF
jgi:hypothetical protein